VLVIQPFCHCSRNQDTTLWWAGLGESASLVTPSIELSRSTQELSEREVAHPADPEPLCIHSSRDHDGSLPLSISNFHYLSEEHDWFLHVFVLSSDDDTPYSTMISMYRTSPTISDPLLTRHAGRKRLINLTPG
jgi:hypothetical protein